MTWNSKFGDEFVDEDRRLKWEFFIGDDCKLTPQAEALLDQQPEGNASMTQLIKLALPYAITFQVFDQTTDTDHLPMEWFRETLTGCWTIFSQNCVYFEKWPDAFHFKMAFG